MGSSFEQDAGLSDIFVQIRPQGGLNDFANLAEFSQLSPERCGGLVVSKVTVWGTAGLLRTTTLTLFLTVSFSTAQAWAGDGSSLFSQKCAGCHTVGGGNRIGPDLAPAVKWSSSDLAKAVKRMEKNVGPLTGEEVDSLVAYLRNPKAANASSSQATTTSSSSSESSPKSELTQTPQAIEPASADKGRRLFFGDDSLGQGGLSCISCHRVDDAGGTMGPDLTLIGAKMPESALISACEQTPYKVMKTAYLEHPVTHQEALDLAAYLFSLKGPHQKSMQFPVSMIGFAIAAFVFAIIAFGYRNRNKSVRAKLQRRN